MNYFIYIPPNYRQENIRASCVYASVSNCLRTVGLWETADKFWDAYKGDPNGETCQGVRYKLRQFGIKSMWVRDEQSLINSLKTGRGCAISWHGAHCTNLVGLINGKAWILDNECPDRYIKQSWNIFLDDFRRSGNWGVIILSGKAPKPKTQKDLRGFDD